MKDKTWQDKLWQDKKRHGKERQDTLRQCKPEQIGAMQESGRPRVQGSAALFFFLSCFVSVPVLLFFFFFFFFFFWCLTFQLLLQLLHHQDISDQRCAHRCKSLPKLVYCWSTASSVRTLMPTIWWYCQCLRIVATAVDRSSGIILFTTHCYQQTSRSKLLMHV